MKIFISIIILFLFYGSSFAAEAWQSLIQQQKVCTACEKKALLIGVGYYRNADNEQLKNLQGPKNDVVLIEQDFLKPILQYKPSEILVLTDALATKANIKEIIENWFLKGEGVRERFFYFSGHGSWIEDEDGDETEDAKDEVVLPHDAAYDSDGSFKPETVIVDDDFRSWFETLKGRRLVAMLDTCHSGTGLRTVGLFSGFSVAQPKYAGNRGGRLTKKKRPAFKKSVLSEDRIPDKHVYLYAAQSSQKALEREFFGHGIHGCFTKAFVDAARGLCARARTRGVEKQVTYAALFANLNNTMKHRMNLEQTPDIQPPFRGNRPHKYQGTDSARLLESFFDASRAHVSASTRTTLPDLDRYRSRVLIIQGPGGALMGDRDLPGLKRYAFVDFGKKAKNYNLYIKVITDAQYVELSNENGYLVNRFKYEDKGDLIKKLQKRVKHAYLKNLLAGIESKHGLPMTLSVKGYDRNNFYTGQEITYVMESDVDAYIYVLAVDAGGELNLYFPFELQPDNHIRAGRRVILPDQRICGADVVLEISMEPGEEIVKVIASPTPLSIKMAEVKDDVLTGITFEQALETIRDMTFQLKKRDVWYEGTFKYMNYTRQEYDRMYR